MEHQGGLLVQVGIELNAALLGHDAAEVFQPVERRAAEVGFHGFCPPGGRRVAAGAMAENGQLPASSPDMASGPIERYQPGRNIIAAARVQISSSRPPGRVAIAGAPSTVT